MQGFPLNPSSRLRRRLSPAAGLVTGKQHDYNIGALIIRIGFGGIVYYNYNKEPPKPYSTDQGSYMIECLFFLAGCGLYTL